MRERCSAQGRPRSPTRTPPSLRPRGSGAAGGVRGRGRESEVVAGGGRKRGVTDALAGCSPGSIGSRRRSLLRGFARGGLPRGRRRGPRAPRGAGSELGGRGAAGRGGRGAPRRGLRLRRRPARARGRGPDPAPAPGGGGARPGCCGSAGSGLRGLVPRCARGVAPGRLGVDGRPRGGPQGPGPPEGEGRGAGAAVPRRLGRPAVQGPLAAAPRRRRRRRWR
mmetsp:Transcript_20020/g.64549  ORF Transcript_20020/g.64549 Transcript_20020/m.64549 type:complete len:222 (+) Transcript_20020:267-932(+)